VPLHAGAVEVARAIPTNVSKRDFLRLLDDLQRAWSSELLRANADKAISKLLIVKAANLLALRHGFYHRHTQLVARPTQIMLDPSNTCQLQCPGCVHSVTAPTGFQLPGRPRTYFDWPKGIMNPESFERIMRDFGPFAFSAVMYNYGEPLINKQFPAMVRRANSLGLYTWTSSNLSLSFDVEAIVGSGLDLLTMSIDGTSQESLSNYRRRAKFDLCLHNMEALVAAKRQRGGGPHLVWQFLTFEHNKHEIDEAIAMAERIGVDELNVVTPLDMTWDDPSVPIFVSEKARRYVFNKDSHLRTAMVPAMTEADEALCDAILAEGWVKRMERLGIEEEPSRAGRRTCDWLYQNVTFDSADRVMPCCMAPTSEEHVNFATLSADAGDFTNNEAFRLARLGRVDRPAYDTAIEKIAGREPHCANCVSKPILNFPVDPHVALQLRRLDPRGVFSQASIGALTDW